MVKSRTLIHWTGRESPNPYNKYNLVTAKPSDVAKEARLWKDFRELNLRPVKGGSSQGWIEVPDAGVAHADGSALANSTVEASILPGAAVLTLPNNFFTIGRSLRWYAAGRVSTTGTPTLRLKICYSSSVNTNVLADTTALTTATLTNNTWWWRGQMTCRAESTTANVMAISELIGVTGTATQVQVPATAPAVSSNFDATSSNPIQLTALWGTASASNTITLHMFILELLNQVAITRNLPTKTITPGDPLVSPAVAFPDAETAVRIAVDRTAGASNLNSLTSSEMLLMQVDISLDAGNSWMSEYISATVPGGQYFDKQGNLILTSFIGPYLLPSGTGRQARASISAINGTISASGTVTLTP